MSNSSAATSLVIIHIPHHGMVHDRAELSFRIDSILEGVAGSIYDE